MKGSKFSPLTFGFEWETLLLKENMLPLEREEMEEAVVYLRSKIPDSPTGFDFTPRFNFWFFEIRSGIIKDFKELKQKTYDMVGVVKDFSKEKGWVFFPVAVHPLFPAALGLHVHIGSIHNHQEATSLANYLVLYAPFFGALSANSPYWGREEGKFKSYRLREFGDWFSVPRTIVSPRFAQSSWREDVEVKIGRKPTIELRIGDSPSFPELVNEYVALVIAFFYGASLTTPKEVGETEYLESLENRFRASRFGLATYFRYNGEEFTPEDFFEIVQKIAAPGIEKIKAEFRLIPKMVEKRITQADFQIAIKTFSDPHSFSRYLANRINDEQIFERFLDSQEKIELKKAESLKDYVLSHITKDTPYWYLYELLMLPFALLEDILRELLEEKRIKVKKSPERGALYSRQRL